MAETDDQERDGTQDSEGPFPTPVDTPLSDADRELLEAMGNCYEVCGADFEDTVRMVARGRGFTEAQAKARLELLGDTIGHDEEYRRLRARLPDEFPF